MRRHNHSLGRFGLLLLLCCCVGVMRCQPQVDNNQNNSQNNNQNTNENSNNQNNQNNQNDTGQTQALYVKYCGLCHGNKGEGYKADGANALANAEFLAVASDTFLTEGIAKGRPGTVMSAWSNEYGGPLAKEQIASMVKLIRGWQTKPSVKIDQAIKGEAKRGELLYEFNCANCHGEIGQGGTYMSLKNPEFLKHASDGFLHYAITKGRTATPMPAYESKLTPQGINDLVALIRSWQKTGVEPPKVPPRTYDPIVINKGGPDPGFPSEGRFIPADTVKAALDKGAEMVIVDARPPGDYVKKHIKGALSIPFYEADKHLDKLPKDKWIISYCGCPHAESGVVYDTLKKNGYTKIKVLNEGYKYWVDEVYPLKEGPNP